MLIFSSSDKHGNEILRRRHGLDWMGWWCVMWLALRCQTENSVFRCICFYETSLACTMFEDTSPCAFVSDHTSYIPVYIPKFYIYLGTMLLLFGVLPIPALLRQRHTWSLPIWPHPTPKLSQLSQFRCPQPSTNFPHLAPCTGQGILSNHCQ